MVVSRLSRCHRSSHESSSMKSPASRSRRVPVVPPAGAVCSRKQSLSRRSSLRMAFFRLLVARRLFVLPCALIQLAIRSEAFRAAVKVAHSVPVRADGLQSPDEIRSSPAPLAKDVGEHERDVYEVRVPVGSVKQTQVQNVAFPPLRGTSCPRRRTGCSRTGTAIRALETHE